MGVVVAPGEAGVAGGTHLRAFGVPGELVGFGVPVGRCGNGRQSEDSGFAIVEGDTVLGKPGGKGFAAAKYYTK